MYNFFLSIHNIIRWVVLVLGLIASLRALLGWLGNREWTDSDRKTGLFFTISMDIQILIGILLYFVFSQWALKAILTKGMAEVMAQSEYRFYAIEHVFFMVFGFVFVHLGGVFTKKGQDSKTKFKRALLLFGLATLLVLFGMPWSRPLFPGL